MTNSQIEEFKSLLVRIDEYASELKQKSKRIDDLEKRYDDLHSQLRTYRKAQLGSSGNSPVRWNGRVPFVSDDCARALSSVYVIGCSQKGRWPAQWSERSTQERMLAEACEILEIERRAASSLTGNEIPLPTIYAPQIVELIFSYGQMRQFGTVFPLGAGTVKLPRLQAGEDKFVFLGVGTAGMSQPVPKVQVAAELVTFTANKFGGIVGIPSEIDQDTFIPLGQFLARYIARRFAYGEDDAAFNGDGTANYANITGLAAYCNASGALTYSVQLAGGKTKPTDATLADFRSMRSKVSPALLQGGHDLAYYLNPTFEPMMRSWNSYPNFVVFQNENGKYTLDGFPVRWIGVSQACVSAPAPATAIAYFGDLSYIYLGERGAPRVQTSLDVYFQTDEIAIRALERIDVEIMAIDAMSSLQTAAV